MRRLLLSLTVGLLALAFSSTAGADTKTVQITSAGFVPTTTTIVVGDTITWHNAGTVNHQVVADDGSFASPVLKPDATYTATFSKAGKTAYHDALHRTLKGTVVVNGLPASLSLDARSQAVTFGSSTVLTGSISSNQSGQTVTLMAQEAGDSSAAQADQTTTSAGGTFRFAVSPTIRTTYSVLWQDSKSSPTTIAVRPRLGLGLRGRFFRVRATSDHSYAGHFVVVQRRRANGFSWFGVKRVFLGASSQARFHVGLPHGRWLVQIAMPASQAGTGYLAGLSRVVAVRHR